MAGPLKSSLSSSLLFSASGRDTPKIYFPTDINYAPLLEKREASSESLNGICFSCPNTQQQGNEQRGLTKRARTQGGPSTNPFVFYRAGSPEQTVAKESPLTTKLRKQRGKEGIKDGKIEERRIINDIEIEFVIEVFLSFM